MGMTSIPSHGSATKFKRDMLIKYGITLNMLSINGMFIITTLLIKESAMDFSLFSKTRANENN